MAGFSSDYRYYSQGHPLSAKGHPLRQAVQQLAGQSGGDLAAAVECHNLARTGELVARAALAREETRGQHHRRDYPGQEHSWQRWVKLQGGDVTTLQVTPSVSYKRG